jgi:hypothetical protein
MTGRWVALGGCVLVALSGCGSGASTPTTVDATTFRACVEKKGYSLSTIDPSTVANDPSYSAIAPLLSAITTSPGYLAGSEAITTSGAVVAVFDSASDATNATSSMKSELQSIGSATLTVGNSRNVVWYGTSQQSKDFSACA